MVGDRIVSLDGIELEVCEVTFAPRQRDALDGIRYYDAIRVELHMPSYCQKMSITEFEERIKRIRANKYEQTDNAYDTHKNKK
jgi:hypothetical protein